MFFFISAAFFATHFKASWEISFDKSLIGVPRLLGANSLAIFNAPPNMLSVADMFADVIERVHNYKEISSIFFK